MRLLLDTHMVLWALQDAPELPAQARKLIADSANTVFYSVAVLWEVQIKHAARPDRMRIDPKKLSELCSQAGYEPLPISASAVLALDTLARPESRPVHSDPFDRIMICQAKTANMTFLTHDALIGSYEEPCVLLV